MSDVDATVGGASSNSYITTAEGDAYHADRLHSIDWTGATADTKRAAVIMATRLLDATYEWANYPTTSEQALQWPRVGMWDTNGIDYVDDSVIPDELKWATAEFARQLIAGDRSADSDVETQGLTRLKAGPVELAFKNNVFAKVIPDAVAAFIPEGWGYIKSRVAGTRPLERT